MSIQPTDLAEPRSANITIHRGGRHVVVELFGEIDVAIEDDIHLLLCDLVDDQGHLDVIVDLADVSFIDSAGIRVLLYAHQTLHRRGGTFVLRAPSLCVLRVLEILGLDEILEIR